MSKYVADAAICYNRLIIISFNKLRSKIWRIYFLHLVLVIWKEGVVLRLCCLFLLLTLKFYLYAKYPLATLKGKQASRLRPQCVWKNMPCIMLTNELCNIIRLDNVRCTAFGPLSIGYSVKRGVGFGHLATQVDNLALNTPVRSARVRAIGGEMYDVTFFYSSVVIGCAVRTFSAKLSSLMILFFFSEIITILTIIGIKAHAPLRKKNNKKITFL